ncbi:hypothetical protein EVAR_46229_1 [Eumeta japonica]|uniref:Uncharacterized protein n=1 Tax=Eumeta variegata TaxID=151549 RepID=A0A4C1XQI6_EUMVA|nr:hypothetical protein EVAR_46229_1 [Eumeta japonica]
MKCRRAAGSSGRRSAISAAAASTGACCLRGAARGGGRTHAITDDGIHHSKAASNDHDERSFQLTFEYRINILTPETKNSITTYSINCACAAPGRRRCSSSVWRPSDGLTVTSLTAVS